MKIGHILKEERLRNNLSQEEVAKAIGSTKQAVYKYETGIVTNIPMEKIAKMAQLFGVTPAYIMGWKEEENTPEETKLSEGRQKLIDLAMSVPEEKVDKLLQLIMLFAEDGQ